MDNNAAAKSNSNDGNPVKMCSSRSEFNGRRATTPAPGEEAVVSREGVENGPVQVYFHFNLFLIILS